MLENYKKYEKVDENEYKMNIKDMEIELGVLQREARNMGIPIIIVVEGWDAAGKGTMINKMLLALDARGCNVYPINPPTEEEKNRPFLWRFWKKTPEKGRIAIFDRSWYGKVLVERVKKIAKKDDWKRAYDEINSFERQLVEDGTLIIKLFLHIDKEEQKNRFEKLLKNESTKWKVTKEDIENNKNYDKFYEAIEDVFEKTNTKMSEWNIINSTDKKTAVYNIFKIIIEKMDEKIRKNKETEKGIIFKEEKIPEILKKVNLHKKISEKEYEDKLKKLQRLRELEHEIYVKKIPVIIAYEGWDAAGKGGNIKRVVQKMDPRGYEVIPIAAPNEVEKKHHYLWRFWLKVPKAGHISIFDRTWYGRVLVERVEKFCSEHDWRRGYQEINDMEKQLADFGVIIIKFWLHIDKDTQYKRFLEREETSYKKWKITEEDWRNREKWDEYEKAVDEMIYRTGTDYAPWYILEADSKYNARIKAMEIIISEIEKKL